MASPIIVPCYHHNITKTNQVAKNKVWELCDHKLYEIPLLIIDINAVWHGETLRERPRSFIGKHKITGITEYMLFRQSVSEQDKG